MNDLNQILDEWEAEAETATEGPWNEGPETGVGHVWVYAGLSPLMEPVGLNGWFAAKCRKLKVAAMGLIRSDNLFQRMHEPTEMYRGRVWQQKQKDAAFIAHSRSTVPRLCKALKEIIAGMNLRERKNIAEESACKMDGDDYASGYKACATMEVRCDEATLACVAAILKGEKQ